MSTPVPWAQHVHVQVHAHASLLVHAGGLCARVCMCLCMCVCMCGGWGLACCVCRVVRVCVCCPLLGPHIQALPAPALPGSCPLPSGPWSQLDPHGDAALKADTP